MGLALAWHHQPRASPEPAGKGLFSAQASGEYHSRSRVSPPGPGNSSAETMSARFAPMLAARRGGTCLQHNASPAGLVHAAGGRGAAPVGGGDHWRNDVLWQLASQHRTRLVDPLPLLGPAPLSWNVGNRPKASGEWDARAGAPRMASKHDCLHWCMHDRVWAPILELVLGQVNK